MKEPNLNKEAMELFEEHKEALIEWLGRVNRPTQQGGYSTDFVAKSIIGLFYGSYVKIRNKVYDSITGLREKEIMFAELLEQIDDCDFVDKKTRLQLKANEVYYKSKKLFEE